MLLCVMQLDSFCRAFLCRGFLSDEECDHLIKLVSLSPTVIHFLGSLEVRRASEQNHCDISKFGGVGQG